LKALAELLIACLELLEAEARALRSGAFRLGLCLVLLGIGGILMASGVGLILRACYLYLAMVLGQATATLIIGLVALPIAGGLLWSARRLSR
jgi:hypothetical protein